MLLRFYFLGCVLIDFRREDGGNASIFYCLFLMDFRFRLKDNGIASFHRLSFAVGRVAVLLFLFFIISAFFLLRLS